MELRNAGTGELTWTVAERETWLGVASSQGDTGGDGEFSGTGNVTLTVHTGGLGAAEGVYEGVVAIRSNGGAVEIPVRMTVGGEDSSGEEPGVSAGETITVELPGGVEMEFVWIEPGTFVMGSPSSEPGRDSDEGPIPVNEIWIINNIK